jgi:hypothetical protein
MVRPPIAVLKQERRRRWSAGAWLVAALVVAGALSLGGIVIETLLADSDDELWSEVARAGVQVVAVGLIGGAVAAAWRAPGPVVTSRCLPALCLRRFPASSALWL